MQDKALSMSPHESLMLIMGIRFISCRLCCKDVTCEICEDVQHHCSCDESSKQHLKSTEQTKEGETVWMLVCVSLHPGFSEKTDVLFRS